VFAAGQRSGVDYSVSVLLIDEAGGRLPGHPATYLNQVWPRAFVGLFIADPACEPYACYGFIANIDALSAVVTPVVVDADGDGVPDSLDKCSGSAQGAAVNGDGCSIAQLVPCAGPSGGGSWKNHGQYVSAVSRTADAFLAAGLITEEQRDAIVAAAAGATCGK